MKKLATLALICCTTLFAFIACDEVEETSVYDNWRERNETFVDSLQQVAGNNFVATVEQADNMVLNTLYAVYVSSVSTNKNDYYIYCKKLTANPTGKRPLYNDTGVKAFYYGTNILGNRFDGNFEGYKSTDKGSLDGSKRMPTQFDAPMQFSISNVIPGWTAALQLMREGERWMLYIPQECGYGTKNHNEILGYSALTFDVILDEVIE
ncbi:MAG: FKBP-type peptidyl-prolyl cis-trans isomerase [Bacteroides sp.]|nr:FKBP-type peptidyl-prolyl cis-trans isomerase [Bacteroides sp.]